MSEIRKPCPVCGGKIERTLVKNLGIPHYWSYFCDVCGSEILSDRRYISRNQVLGIVEFIEDSYVYGGGLIEDDSGDYGTIVKALQHVGFSVEGHTDEQDTSKP